MLGSYAVEVITGVASLTISKQTSWSFGSYALSAPSSAMFSESVRVVL